MRIIPKKAKAMLSFISTDTTQPSLTGMFLSGNRIIATDGHALVEMPLDGEDCTSPEDYPQVDIATSDDNRDVIIPAAALKKAFANIPKGGYLPSLQNIAVVSGENNKNVNQVELITTDLDVQDSVKVPPIDAQYPDSDRVYPAKDATGIRIKVDATFLAKLKDLSAGDDVNGVILTIHDAKSALEFETNGFKGLIMPLRMDARE